MKKTIILVDGQNLYYNLREMAMKESQINWSELFKSLIEPDEELSRTYWFRPAKISDSFFTLPNLTKMVVKKEFPSFKGAIYTNPGSIPPAIKAQIDAKAVEAEEWLRAERIKFSRIEYNYDQIALEHDNIEFVKTGIVKVNPLSKVYIGEKGVDISLAVKMIAISHQGSCDRVVLVSGDYDYAEAIKYVKNQMTKISIVKVHKGVPPQNRSVSRDLAVLADKVKDVYESEIRAKYMKVAPGAAPTV